jgi:hypothetical protein
VVAGSGAGTALSVTAGPVLLVGLAGLAGLAGEAVLLPGDAMAAELADAGLLVTPVVAGRAAAPCHGSRSGVVAQAARQSAASATAA